MYQWTTKALTDVTFKLNDDRKINLTQLCITKYYTAVYYKVLPSVNKSDLNQFVFKMKLEINSKLNIHMTINC